MRVLILYTELAGYVIGNIRRFLQLNPQAELLLIHYPVNAEAPFNFDFPPGFRSIVFNSAKAEEIQKEISKFNPELVLCSGWSNKQYINWVKNLEGSVKKVICFDNQWKGNFKQVILSILSPFTFLKMFHYAWVPGLPQKAYALKLGFKNKNVHLGLYPADTELFIPIGKEKLAKKGSYPKVMISVARYIAQKDLPTLWEAFISANSATGNKWVLNCFGYGELYEQRVQNAYINHLGFKQPRELEPYVKNAGVYVLPSTYEPWGVAVHEMALSALPLVLSDKVGASTMFLNKDNGFSFQAGNVSELTTILRSIMEMTDESLWMMAENSYKNGLKLKSDDWSDTLLNIYKDK